MSDRLGGLRMPAAVILGIVALLWASSGEAQTRGRIAEVGPVVTVTAAGDEVRAAGARVSVDGASARVKAAGATVEIRGAVEGDVWAAGADVTIGAQIGGNVGAVAAQTSVRGQIAGDLAAAGAVVDIDLAVGGSLKAAGANVRIGPLTTIGGTLHAAGANVTFEGRVTGSADFAGAVVTIDGATSGPVRVHAQRVIVGPRAVIAGPLLLRTLTDPQIDPAATVSGEVVREGPGEWFDRVPPATAPIVAGGFAVAILLFGILFLLFARNTYGEAVDHVRLRPVSSLAYGVVGLVLIVLFAAVLMATVIGLPLGLALLALIPLVLVLALPVAAGGMVGWVAGRRVIWLGIGRLVLYLILGAAILAGLCLVPVTGPWIVLAALLFGAGGFLRATLWRFRIVRPAGPLPVTPGIGANRDTEGEAR